MQEDMLSKFLNGPDEHEELSDVDFDSQLLGSKSGSDAKLGGTDVQSLLSNAFKNAGKQMEREEEVRDAVKIASHGVRVIAPLYLSIIKNIDYNDAARVQELMSNVLRTVREDSYKVSRIAYGLEDKEVPAWLHSRISGQVMDIIVSALERNNGSFESVRKSQYLEPIIEALTNGEGKGIGSTYYDNPDNPDLQIANALMMATASVMAEYQAFTYFNSDPKQVARQVSQVIKGRVIDETLVNLTSEWKLSPQERGYIGSTLLSNAGKLMASSWASNAIATLEHLQSLDADERKSVLVTGYPLDVVFDEFENFYGGLEVSAQASLELLRQPAVGKSNGLASTKRETPSPGMR